MNFEFDLDFDSEEVTIFVNSDAIGIVYKDEDNRLVVKRIKKEFEDYQDELLKICRIITSIGDSY